jgi:hypothetical protein
MSAKKDSSSVTMADLNMAVKPLMEAVNKLREELSANGSQLSEILQIVTGLSVKFDTVEQTVSNLNDESKVPKKTGGRKPAAKGAKKPAAKKAATKKKVVEPADEGTADDDITVDDNEDDGATTDLDDEATTDLDGTNNTDVESVKNDDSKKKTATKKAPPKKPSAPLTTAKAVPKKAPIKASAGQDVTRSNPVKKSKAPAKKAITRVYKMNLFKEAYTEDPKRFNKQLTKDVLNTIAAENKEKWSELSGEKLEMEKIAAYFHYVKNHHDDVLEDLKKKFLAVDGNGTADVGDEDPDEVTTDE